jgi:hypothetical protein
LGEGNNDATLGKKAMPTIVLKLGIRLETAMILKVNDNTFCPSLLEGNVLQGKFLKAVMFILTSDGIWGLELSSPISNFINEAEIAAIKDCYSPIAE